MNKASSDKSNASNNLPAEVENDRIAEEIAKRLSAIVPGSISREQRAQIVAQMTSIVVKESFSGPIPHPKHFGEYERHLPGSGQKLISMAESNLIHQQELQKWALKADVDDMKEGRRLGFAALVILMLGAIVCGILEKDGIAYALLGATVIGTIGQLIKGRGKNTG